MQQPFAVKASLTRPRPSCGCPNSKDGFFSRVRPALREERAPLDVSGGAHHEPKRRQGNTLVFDVYHMSVLCKSPKEARAKIRVVHAPGFYICRSGKKKVRTLPSRGGVALEHAECLFWRYFSIAGKLKMCCALEREGHFARENSSGRQPVDDFSHQVGFRWPGTRHRLFSSRYLWWDSSVLSLPRTRDVIFRGRSKGTFDGFFQGFVHTELRSVATTMLAHAQVTGAKHIDPAFRDHGQFVLA